MTDSPTLALVISDIHLQPNNPQHPINQTFLRFLSTTATKAPKLFILGDLFETWLGDDIGLQSYQTELYELKSLVEQGTQVFLQYGNRDFLMRQAFTDYTGITLLPDEYPAKIGTHKILMVHGDQLCTQDIAYQKMRKWFRTPWIQWIFLYLPKKQRLKIGQKMRHNSQSTGRSKSLEVMDAQQSAIEHLMQNYPDYRNLVHGHTHQPNHYQFKLNQQTIHRYVLSDWRPETTYLCIDADQITINHFV